MGKGLKVEMRDTGVAPCEEERMAGRERFGKGEAARWDGIWYEGGGGAEKGLRGSSM